MSLPVSCLRKLLCTRLEGAVWRKRYPGYLHDSQAPIVSAPLPFFHLGDVCVDVRGGSEELACVLCLLCAPLPSPGVQASLPGTRCHTWGTGRQEGEKTTLKYPSACPLWKLRIMWLNKTYEINLPVSQRRGHQPFA